VAAFPNFRHAPGQCMHECMGWPCGSRVTCGGLLTAGPDRRPATVQCSMHDTTSFLAPPSTGKSSFVGPGRPELQAADWVGYLDYLSRVLSFSAPLLSALLQAGSRRRTAPNPPRQRSDYQSGSHTLKVPRLRLGCVHFQNF